MPQDHRSLGATMSMRATLAMFLSLSFLCGYISIWRMHSKYFGGGGWGMDDSDDALLAGAWSPVPESHLADKIELPKAGKSIINDKSPSIRMRRKTSKHDANRVDKIQISSADTRINQSSKQSSDQSDALRSAESTRQFPQNRVYCMVPFIWTPSAFQAYHDIHASWGKRCHILTFFIDPVIGDDKVSFFNMTESSDVAAAKKANLTLPDDVVILHDMRRPWHTCGSEDNEKQGKPVGNCRNIFEKVWRMMVFVADGLTTDDGEGEHDAEWFVKVDQDTFLFPENVGHYVKTRGWSSNDPHYFGHVLNHRKNDRGVSIVAGGAVFYSRAAILAAADAFRHMPMDKGDEEEDGTCRDSYTGTEEVVTAVCLKEGSNVIAEPAVDPEGREQVSLYEVDNILGYNRTEQGEWWFWEGKKRYPCQHDNPEDCLAHLPLAFHHYKDSRYFLDFEKEFHGSVMKGEDDATLIRINDRVAARHWDQFEMTYRYFEKVRAAMKKADVTMSNTMQPILNTNCRLYCMVPFIWTPKYIPSYNAIRKTWGKRCDILKFMIDPIVGDYDTGFVDLRTDSGFNYKLPEDVVVISDMKRPWNEKQCLSSNDGNCRNIWEKIWRSWKWVDAYGDSNVAEWFVKIDADSFLFPENAKRYVKGKGWSPDEHHYFGNILRHREHGVAPMIAGAAVFFSRATLKAIASVFNKFETHNGGRHRASAMCQDEHTDQEEVITAWCLKENFGVGADPALDEAGRELVTVGEIEDVLLWNRAEQGEWWYWKNKPRKHPETGEEGVMHHCCGDLPIAFHGYKDSQWFFKLENEFYSEVVSDKGDGWKGYDWRNPKETNGYFGRVRKAMKKAQDLEP